MAWQQFGEAYHLDEAMTSVHHLREVLNTTSHAPFEAIYYKEIIGLGHLFLGEYYQKSYKQQAKDSICMIMLRGYVPLCDTSLRILPKQHDVQASLEASKSNGIVLNIDGDGEFEQHFTVIAQEKHRAKLVLSPYIRGQLLETQNIAPGNHEWLFGETQIVFRVIRSVDDPLELELFFKMLSRFTSLAYASSLNQNPNQNTNQNTR